MTREQQDSKIRKQIAFMFVVVYKRQPTTEEIEERFNILRGRC